jgi:hypothetical protein
MKRAKVMTPAGPASARKSARNSGEIGGELSGDETIYKPMRMPSVDGMFKRILRLRTGPGP